MFSMLSETDNLRLFCITSWRFRNAHRTFLPATTSDRSVMEAWSKVETAAVRVPERIDKVLFINKDGVKLNVGKVIKAVP